MKTDLKPTDPEYIEALANDLCPNTTHTNFERYQLRLGYQLALSHTNHTELVESVKELMGVIINDDKFVERNFQKIANVNDILTKSETSKL